MLTDDHLTRELGAAFREATHDLEYAGTVPAPRRTPLLLVPAAALSAAAVVLVAGSLGDGPQDAQPATPGRSTPTSQPRLVTDTVTVAGYTFSYQRRAGAPDPFRTQLAPHGLPAGARKVAITPPAKAWVGTDPGSGDAALYVEAPTRNDGKLFAVLSSTWTRAELVHLLQTGRRNG